MIRLLVGLGNPGPEYEAHAAQRRLLVDRRGGAQAAARRCVPERSYFGLVARVNRPDGPVWLLEPMTYMNLSGKSVAALARFFKIAAAADPRRARRARPAARPDEAQARRQRSRHNGVKDIHAQLGSADFWRLRLGIGHPGVKAEVVDYVLRKPSPEAARRDRQDASSNRSTRSTCCSPATWSAR